MKTKIFLFLLVMVSLQACDLTEVPLDRYSSTTFYKSESDAKSALTGVYADLLQYGFYKSSYFPMLEASSDALFCFDGAESYILFGQKKYNSDTPFIKFVWYMMYMTIQDANLVIANVPNINFDQNSKNRILGEAYFLRGWTYFNLVRTFGGVPVRLTPTVDASNLYISKSSVDSVYSVIFSDLKKASALMPYKAKQPANELGRANKGSAQAILSLAYLTREQWQNALTYSDSVISNGGYSLMNNYADLWDVSKEGAQANEVCFALQFTRDPLTGGAASIGSDMPNIYVPSNAAGMTGNKASNGGGSGRIKVQPFFYKMYNTGDYYNATSKVLDYRTEKTFLSKWSTGKYDSKGSLIYTTITPTNYYQFRYAYLAKYTDPAGLDSRNSENNLNIIRLAEVYLIKAEALNELNRTTEALVPFNIVRDRAQKADGTTVRPVPVQHTITTLTNMLGSEPTLKDKFREVIFHERGLELIGECSRWFDLVRMKRSDGRTYYEYMLDPQNGYVKDHNLVAGVNELASPGNCNDYVPSNLLYFSKYKLFPISQEEFLNNSALSSADQNPGY